MRFLTVFLSRLKILFADKLFILAILIIPLFLSIIMGYAQRKEKLGYIPVAIVDEDGSALSKILIVRFSDKEGIQATLTDRKTAERLIDDEKAEATVIIKKGFEENLINDRLEESIEVVKSPATLSVELLKEILAAEVIRLRASDFAYDWLEPRYSERGLTMPGREEVWRRVESYWQPEPLMTIQYEEIKAKALQAERITIPPFAAASLGILVLFIMLALLFGSGWICEERLNGTLSRIVSSPGATFSVFAGNILALLVLGGAQTLIFVLVQRIFFDVTMLSGVAAWTVLFAYMLCAVSISMLMASFFKTAAQLQAVAPVFSILTGFMGGCLWNLAGIPKDLMTLAHLTPQGWALSGITTLYANPNDWTAVLPSIAILLGAALVMLFVAYRGLVSVKTYQIS